MSNKCQARAEGGKPCGAYAIKAGRYCSLHGAPNRAKELGRKGGRRNRRQNSAGILDKPVTVPKNASDLLQMLLEAFGLTFSGQMIPAQAKSLAYLASVALEAEEVVEFAKELALLKKQNREMLKSLSVDSAHSLPMLDSADSEEEEQKPKTPKPC